MAIKTICCVSVLTALWLIGTLSKNSEEIGSPYHFVLAERTIEQAGNLGRNRVFNAPEGGYYTAGSNSNEGIGESSGPTQCWDGPSNLTRIHEYQRMLLPAGVPKALKSPNLLSA